MQRIWFYKNKNGGRAHVVLSGDVTIACVGHDRCRFPSPALADRQLAVWGYEIENKDDKERLG